MFIGAGKWWFDLGSVQKQGRFSLLLSGKCHCGNSVETVPVLDQDH